MSAHHATMVSCTVNRHSKSAWLALTESTPTKNTTSANIVLRDTSACRGNHQKSAIPLVTPKTTNACLVPPDTTARTVGARATRAKIKHTAFRAPPMTYHKVYVMKESALRVIAVARQMGTWCAAPTVKHIKTRVTRGAPVSTPGALVRATRAKVNHKTVRAPPAAHDQVSVTTTSALREFAVVRQMGTWCAAPTVKHTTARVTRSAPVSTRGASARAKLQAAQNVVVPTQANAAVALEAVPGSRIVGKAAIQDMRTPGLRASTPAVRHKAPSHKPPSHKAPSTQCAPYAARTRKAANATVALLVVLGIRTADSRVSLTSHILGLREKMLAKPRATTR